MADSKLEAPDTLSKNEVINRGGVPSECEKVDVKAIDDCIVHDELGNPKRFGELHKDQKTIVIFIRHYLCFFTFDYVKDLAKVRKEALEAAGVKLIIIGCAPFKFTREFRRDTACPYPIYSDAERLIYTKLGCVQTGAAGTQTSKHVTGSYMMGIVKSTLRAIRHREWQGDPRMQGASMIIGPGEDLDFIHIDKASADHVPINDLLRCVGIEPVNFQKDPRVLDI